MIKSFFYLGIAGLFLFCSGLAFAGDAVAKKAPYKDNEKLVFDVSYLGVIGGTTVMEIVGTKKIGGRDAYHVISTTRTSDFFSHFYEVNDIIETFIDTQSFVTLRMKIDQHEGDHINKGDILFDQEHNKAIFTKESDKKIVYDILDNVQDSLSGVFYTRHLDLEVGKNITFDVFAGRKCWQLILKVLKKEKIKVKAGVFNTILVQPIAKYNDVFVNKGEIFIWFTDDSRRIPVKMKSKIVIGAITAELISQNY